MGRNGAGTGDQRTECSARWNTAMTDALLFAAALTPDSVVLDLAAGSGDPALTSAERAICGRIIVLDSSLCWSVACQHTRSAARPE